MGPPERRTITLSYPPPAMLVFRGEFTPLKHGNASSIILPSRMKQTPYQSMPNTSWTTPKPRGRWTTYFVFMARDTKYVKGTLFERLFTAIAGRARIEWGVVIKIRLIVKLPKYEKRFHQKISSSL